MLLKRDEEPTVGEVWAHSGKFTSLDLSIYMYLAPDNPLLETGGVNLRGGIGGGKGEERGGWGGIWGDGGARVGLYSLQDLARVYLRAILSNYYTFFIRTFLFSLQGSPQP